MHKPLSGVVVAFDLDDTLYFEREYVFSGFSAICELLSIDALAFMRERFEEGSPDVFQEVVEKFAIPIHSKPLMLEVYRNHQPKISLRDGAFDCLRKLHESGACLALITDGRSVSQRKKISALGIESDFQCIVISEEIGSAKPANSNFLAVSKSLPANCYFYVGDNFEKDFLAPNLLLWSTIAFYPNPGALRDQNRKKFSQELLPSHCIETFHDLYP